jgi:hypothetical protein
MISNKRKLTCLGLSNNAILEEGAVYLANNGLKEKSALTKLSLEGNMIAC